MKAVLPSNHLLQSLIKIDCEYELGSSEEDFFLHMKENYGARAINKNSTVSTMIYYYLWATYVEKTNTDFQRQTSTSRDT